MAEASKKTERAWRDLRRAAAPLRDHDVAGGHLREALTDNLQAWEGEEGSVMEEHAELIEETRAALEATKEGA